MGCSVGRTATLAAFMATKPTGEPGLHPERSGRAEASAEDGEGGLFCSAMERRVAPPENSLSSPLPARPACGPIALSKAEARSPPAGWRIRVGMAASHHPASSFRLCRERQEADNVLGCELRAQSGSQRIQAKMPEILVEIAHR